MQSFTQDAAEWINNERRVLDLADLSKHKRAHALQAFDSLPPGGSLEIITRCKPGHLFFELQHHLGLGFYWWPLERGPVLWRAMLAKPALSVKPTVSTMMSAHHEHLNQLWEELETAVELHHIGCIHRCAGELALGTRRYIDIEEALLFPLLDAQTAVKGKASTAAMRLEHRQIRRALDQFDKLRQITDYAEVLQSYEQDIRRAELFEIHCRKEERMLYPIMEIAFNLAEKSQLLPVIQAFEI